MSPPAKDKVITMRVSTEDLDAWRAEADLQDMGVSDWIRRTCRAAIKKAAAKR